VVAASAASSGSAAVARVADGVGGHAEQVRAAAEHYRRNDQRATEFEGPR
jgi:outer membrane murein-binding lipoprotein Lpp